ncbi:hypothetical protein QT381_13025 [Galbitalea sp. SE-J8]|uniref:hypothetical protein n=1 Tax=Galbitalea sp. SE-J8 TaxID=3054952 RepID=UPI00259CA958|nr:hypothetical protein [Galbitalea sp. SE-J8]MDM4763930.1 hypothetical protein [Galbitalea sp. SE-J8]
MHVTEPQVWTIIGIVGAMLFSMIGIVSGAFVRVLRAEIGGLRSEIGGLRSEIGGLRSETKTEIGGLRAEMKSEFGAVRAEIGGLRAEMNARFDAVDTRFTVLEGRFDNLDRDVAAITHTVFHDRE